MILIDIIFKTFLMGIVILLPGYIIADLILHKQKQALLFVTAPMFGILNLLIVYFLNRNFGIKIDMILIVLSFVIVFICALIIRRTRKNKDD